MSKAVAKVEEAPAPASIAQSEASALISMIERAARDPSVDIAKMERLFEMQQKAAARRAEQEFAISMAAAQAEMGPVVRNRPNSQTNSKYADLEAIAKAVTPIITKHGFGASFGADVSPRPGHERVVCDLSHSAGHTRRYFIDVPFDKTGIAGKVNKTDTHALASTHTYGRRLLKVMMFDVATFDDDGNAAGAGEIISAEQAAQLAKLLNTPGQSLTDFLNYFKLDRLEHLPVKDFERAMASISKRAQMVKS